MARKTQSVNIQENGVDNILSDISVIVTQVFGGGTAGWVLDNVFKRKNITIKKNKTVNASDKKVDGFHVVTVKVRRGVTGKKPDGNDWYVDDDDDGNLLYEKIPTSMEITTNPTKITYQSGEMIDLTGITVKGYNGDGTLWGVVPIGELEPDPVEATGSGNQTVTVNWDRDGDGETLSDTYTITVT